MEQIRVGSFNTKDNRINREGNIEHAELVAQKVKEFDFLGTQELTVRYINRIESFLPDYQFYGNYRYGKGILLNMPYNESNSIITDKKVHFESTVWLPWIPKQIGDLKESIVKASIMPRIATILIAEDKNQEKLCMINTHLDYQIEAIQVRQLKAIKGLIEKYSKDYPTILTGDFNMQLNQEHFSNFVQDLNEVGVKRVEINAPTHKDAKTGEEKTLDHIFVSKEFEIENAGVMHGEIDQTSDHHPIYAEVTRRR